MYGQLYYFHCSLSMTLLCYSIPCPIHLHPTCMLYFHLFGSVCRTPYPVPYISIQLACYTSISLTLSVELHTLSHPSPSSLHASLLHLFDSVCRTPYPVVCRTPYPVVCRTPYPVPYFSIQLACYTSISLTLSVELHTMSHTSSPSSLHAATAV